MKVRTHIALFAATVFGATLAVPSAQACGGATCKKPAASTVSATQKAQTICPVMGGKVDKSKFVDVNGKRIYVCCGGCIAKVKANPSKYIKKLEAQGVTLEKAPVKKEAKSSGHTGHSH